MTTLQLTTAVLLLGMTAAVAAPSKYQITEAERAACGNDAMSYCGDAYPDEDKLLVCMRRNRPHLTSGCRAVFEAGLRRRGLQ